MITAQHLDRSITIRRNVGGTNELNETIDDWQPVLTVRARRNDLSDGEKFAAGGVGGFRSARFTVRSTVKTRAIRPSDDLLHDGGQWNIVGLKEAEQGRRQFLEITAKTDAD